MYSLHRIEIPYKGLAVIMGNHFLTTSANHHVPPHVHVFSWSMMRTSLLLELARVWRTRVKRLRDVEADLNIRLLVETTSRIGSKHFHEHLRLRNAEHVCCFLGGRQFIQMSTTTHSFLADAGRAPWKETRNVCESVAAGSKNQCRRG